MENENRDKYDILMGLLGEGDAMVCLDARNPDVDVPSQHKNDPSLNLIFNLNFRRPLDIRKEGIYVTLSFQGRPHPCVIPFDAVWAIYDPNLKKGQVWEESLPKDINLAEQLVQKQNAKPEKAVAKVAPGGKKERPGSPSPGKRDRSHLRVIK